MVKSDTHTIPCLDTSIDTVYVYRVNALVRRTGKLGADNQGKYPDKVKITGLPLCLDDSFVRAGILGSDQEDLPHIYDVKMLVEAPDPDPSLAPPTNEELKEARFAKEKIKLQITEIDRAIKRIHSIRYPERIIPQELKDLPESPITGRLTLKDFSIKRIEALFKGRKELYNQLREVNELLRELEDRERRATKARQTRENELGKATLISLQTPADCANEITIFFDYMIPGARWAPLYSLHFNHDFQNCTLLLRALVCQNTGEDWHQVRLVLSTAESFQWVELPKLTSKRIGRVQPSAPAKGWKEPPQGADLLYVDYDRFRADNLLPACDRESRSLAKIERPVAGTAAEEPPLQYGEAVGDVIMEGQPSDKGFKVLAGKFKKAEKRVKPKAKKLAKPSSSPPQSVSIGALKDSDSEEPWDHPMEIAIRDEMLDFGQLRLPEPHSPFRSNLKTISKKEQYQQMLSEQNLDTYDEIMPKISESITMAKRSGKIPAGSNLIFPSSQRGFDYSFTAETPMNINADGQFHTLSIFQEDLESHLLHIVVPRESSDTFRLVSFDNQTQGPLLPGPVDISVDSHYLMTTKIDTVPQGGKAEIGCGVEQGIKVARNTWFEEQTTGLMKGDLCLKHTITIDLTNTLSDKKQIEVRERIPTNIIDKTKKDEKIKIEIIRTDPEWEKFDQAPHYLENGFRWQISLEPGEKKSLRAEYHIIIPANYEISAGNRREV